MFRRCLAYDDASSGFQAEPVQTGRAVIMGRCRFSQGCDCNDRIGLYLAGNQDACNEMIPNLTPLIAAIVRRILRSSIPHDHEDAVQEVLWKVFNRLDVWRGECPFCNWVQIVAARHAITLNIAQTRKIRTVSLPPGDIAGSPPDTSSRDLGDCPEKVLAKVPAKWRQVFDLIYKEERLRKDVAEIVGQPLRTIDDWLAKMREQIRNCVENL